MTKRNTGKVKQNVSFVVLTAEFELTEAVIATAISTVSCGQRRIQAVALVTVAVTTEALEAQAL